MVEFFFSLAAFVMIILTFTAETIARTKVAAACQRMSCQRMSCQRMRLVSLKNLNQDYPSNKMISS